MTWKSTSSSGWEYFIVCEDLGSSPMYANYVLFDLLLNLIMCMIMLSDNISIELCELSWNVSWLNGYALIWQLAWYGFEHWWTQS